MTSVSPSDDLCILAAVYNHPEKTWQEISGLIHYKYLKIIPAQICEERYETFLKHIDHIHEIGEIVPFMQTQYSKGEKIPQNFIFHYVELKKRFQLNEYRQSLSFIGRYEKKLIAQLFYGKMHNQSKTTQKEKKKELSQDQLINRIYQQIKVRCSNQSLINEKILTQKVEQIIFDIIERVNEVLQSNKQEKIENSLAIIKLFKANCLIDERREIFELYFTEKQLKLDAALLIAGKFRYVYAVFGYEYLKDEYESVCNQSEITYEHPGQLVKFQRNQQINSNAQITFHEKQKVYFEEQPKIENQEAENQQQIGQNQIIGVENIRPASGKQNETSPSQQDNNLPQTRQPSTHQQMQLQEHGYPQLNQSGPRQNICSFSMNTMQISIINKQVIQAEGIQPENGHDPQIKQETQIKTETKFEEVEVKVEIDQPNQQGVRQEDKSKKKYKIIKKRRLPPAKMPKYSKTVIVIND